MKPQMSQQEKQVRDYFTRTYASMKRHQHQRKQGGLPFTKSEFIKWFWQQENSRRLFTNWVSHNCPKNIIPSVDRIDDTQGYQFDNMRITTFRDNHQQQSLKRSVPVQQINSDGDVVAIHQSMSQAARTLGLPRSAIPRAIKTGGIANGYYWRKVPQAL